MTREEKSPLWAVPFPIQEEQIGAWCWGQGCGKGHIGAVDLGPATAVVCSEPTCPFVDRQMDEPLGEVEGGRPVFLRKLREVKEG